MNASTVQPRVIHSFSSLNCYDNICPYQFYRRWMVKDIPFTDNANTLRGTAIHTALEQRVGGGKPLPDGMQHYEPFAIPFDGTPRPLVEQKFAIDINRDPVDFWDKDRVFIRGKIDLVLMTDRTAYINDWKSNKNIREEPFELEVGAMLLHASYPDLEKIVGTYTWLNHSKVGKLYDLTDTCSTWGKCYEIAANIEQDIAMDHFEKRKGPLCGWCSVLDCENNRNATNQ